MGNLQVRFCEGHCVSSHKSLIKTNKGEVEMSTRQNV